MAMTRLERAASQARRRVRASSTSVEEALWHHLRRLPGEGRHFLRQERIGPYLADFVSDRLRLVIELDGAQHGRPEQSEKDARRDRVLSEQGYAVLRFPNDDVRKSLPAVLDTIRAVVEERRALPPGERPHALPVESKPRPRPRPRPG